MAGRNQERPLTVFGRFMRIAAQRKANALGLKRYTWQRLSKDAGTNPTLVLKAVSGENKPEMQNVWRWIRVLEPGPELARLICHSLGYATEEELAEAEARIDALEQAEGLEPLG